MNPIVKHAVNQVLRISPDFPVEKYTWIVDPKGFIGGTNEAVAALWPEFGPMALKCDSSGRYLADMKHTLIREDDGRLIPSLPAEWLSVVADCDDAEFSKLPVLSPNLAMVLQPSESYGCVLFVDLLSFVVSRIGFSETKIAAGWIEGWREISAVAFDSSGAAVATVSNTDRPHTQAWDRDWVITNSDEDYCSDYGLSTASLAIKRAIDLSRTSTVAYLPTRQRHASRRAAGRKPAFEWRTVVIESVRPNVEHKGGTHASPRQHDRRGHWSHSKLGKKFWVPPCKVGKASNGTVFHDYVVK